MKFHCSKKDLVEAIQVVSGAIGKEKSDIKILSGIYMHADADLQTVEFQATDNEIGAVCYIMAEVEETGKVVVSGSFFANLCRALPGDDVFAFYESDQQTLKLQSEKFHTKLLCMDADEFQTVSHAENGVKFSLSSNALKRLISKTTFACANRDEGNPIFSGCLIELNNQEIKFTATNRQRLAINSEPLTSYEGEPKRFIVPKRILEEVAHLLSSPLAEEDMQINCTDKEISFTLSNLYLTSRLIEGDYPDCNRLIPTSFKLEAKVLTADFLATINRVALIAQSTEYKVMKLSFANNQITISSVNQDIGQIDESVQATLTGEDLLIGFNCQYLLDVVKRAKENVLCLGLNSPISPLKVTEVNDDSFVYIVTPVRLLD